jgi:hypothetical protein
VGDFEAVHAGKPDCYGWIHLHCFSWPFFGCADVLGLCLTAELFRLAAGYLEKPQVTKGICSWLGPDFVRVPALRRRSLGPPPTAIHGGGRLSRHPCRSAHCAPPAFGLHPSRDLRCLNWRGLRAKSRKQKTESKKQTLEKQEQNKQMPPQKLKYEAR